MEHKRRSSRSGSLVNTPDNQPKQMNIPDGTLFSLDDADEGSNYLETNDSSATNSTCSFDTPPYVPPRITNPPPRNARIAAREHLIIVDSNVSVDTVPIPATRTRASKMQMYMIIANNNLTAAAAAKPPIFTRNTSFVPDINSLNLQKNNNGVNRAGPPPHIDPPPKSINHKLNMTNETILPEVRRIPLYRMIFF